MSRFLFLIMVGGFGLASWGALASEGAFAYIRDNRELVIQWPTATPFAGPSKTYLIQREVLFEPERLPSQPGPTLPGRVGPALPISPLGSGTVQVSPANGVGTDTYRLPILSHGNSQVVEYVVSIGSLVQGGEYRFSIQEVSSNGINGGSANTLVTEPTNPSVENVVLQVRVDKMTMLGRLGGVQACQFQVQALGEEGGSLEMEPCQKFRNTMAALQNRPTEVSQPEVAPPEAPSIQDQVVGHLVDPYSRDENNPSHGRVKYFENPEGDNMQLVFSDEFDTDNEGNGVPGNQINPHRWSTKLQWGPRIIINRERQYYVDIQDETVRQHIPYNPFEFRYNPSTNTGTLLIKAIKIAPENSGKIGRTVHSMRDFGLPMDSHYPVEFVHESRMSEAEKLVWAPLASDENTPSFQWTSDSQDGLAKPFAPEVEPPGPRPAYYLSGVLSTYRKNPQGLTQPTFAATRGIFEARIKLHKGDGMFPAFWLHHVKHEQEGYVRRGEIDIMENLGDNIENVYTTTHWSRDPVNDASWAKYPTGGNNWNHLPQKFLTADDKEYLESRGYPPGRIPENVLPEDPNFDGFHIFSVRWRTEYIDPNNPSKGRRKLLEWYVDEYPDAITSLSSESVGYEDNMFPDEPMYLILNLAMGGNWWERDHHRGPQPPPTINEGIFEIDWVRVFQKRGEVENQNIVYPNILDQKQNSQEEGKDNQEEGKDNQKKTNSLLVSHLSP